MSVNTAKIKNRKGNVIFKILVNIIFILASLCCVAPLILVFAVSITPDKLIGINGYQFIPKQISFEAYKYILLHFPSIWRSFGVSLFVTCFGTALGLIVTSMLAYPLSRHDVKYRNGISMIIFFTMLFNGGLVPSYILITQYLHLQNTIWVMILPLLVSPWNVMLMRNFFRTGVPFSIIEAAKVDGVSEFGTFVRIVVPISVPTFATIGLFLSLGYWNDWWQALMYIDERSLFPIQYTLQSILLNIQVLSSNIQFRDNVQDIPMESSRMALCALAVLPILFAYPFFQKYIISGMTIGAVKG